MSEVKQMDTVELKEVREELPETKRKKRANKKKKSLTGCFPAKVAAFFLLVVSSFVTAASVSGCVLALDGEFYLKNNNFDDAFLDVIDYSILQTAAFRARDMIESGAPDWEIKNYFEQGNLDIELLYGDAGPVGSSGSRLIWGTYDGSYTPVFTVDIRLSFHSDSYEVTVGETALSTEEIYLYRVYVDPALSHNDEVRLAYDMLSFLFNWRYHFIWASLIGGSLLILSFVFLMCSAGHSNKEEESRQGARPGIWLDVLAAFFVVTTVPVLVSAHDMLTWIGRWEIIYAMLIVGSLAAVLSLWGTAFLYLAARQVKRGNWWKHTLIYVVLKFCYKNFKLFGKGVRKVIHFLGKGFLTILRGLPTVITTLIIFLGVCFVELVGMMLGLVRPEFLGLVLWLFEKVILLALVLYAAFAFKRLLKASGELAEGRQDRISDTSWLLGDFETFHKNLNSIGEGITRAVEARMKSERLKTELITNVSHDLKTPLTSIINYSDLICEENTENEKIREYSQVLKRQSGRLKKLLEDLVEASKATTGNLEVNIVPCEVGVILSQAVGEYQQKLEEKQLDLRITQPENTVRIMADGRHLWRVFDNLLNNICKYAQEGTRVYLDVVLKSDQVHIIFRNMSKYPLNISAEELEERFVRGDKSRHMEGNGLGLSIAKSLMELQGGGMEIITDGDLFKVTLSFDVIRR